MINQGPKGYSRDEMTTDINILGEALERCGGFSSLAMIWGECSTSHSPPALVVLKWRVARAH